MMRLCAAPRAPLLSLLDDILQPCRYADTLLIYAAHMMPPHMLSPRMLLSHSYFAADAATAC